MFKKLSVILLVAMLVLTMFAPAASAGSATYRLSARFGYYTISQTTPVAGATLTVYNQNGYVAAQGTTNSDGVAFVTGYLYPGEQLVVRVVKSGYPTLWSGVYTTTGNESVIQAQGYWFLYSNDFACVGSNCPPIR